MTPAADTARRITVRGLVQGVGFRPYVYHLARQTGIAGSVRNTGAGVEIDVFGPASAIAAFRGLLTRQPPPLARIEAVDCAALGSAERPGDFRIETSGAGPLRAAATPDAGLCAACRAEMADAADRRHGYAFLNCTHCGPRFSILRTLPYDRSNTTMRAFAMCDACRGEYDDAGDRRFHAQPTACPACGPTLWAETAGSRARIAENAAAVAAAARCLGEAGIVALKGIGGFHLACDARNGDAVARLRRRKHRPTKPFAIMVGDLAQARTLCRIDAAEAEALASPVAPIVLLKAAVSGSLQKALAPGLNRLGVMLAYSPLHALLLRAFGGPLVMTSGNRGGDPQLTENAAARAELGSFADLLLLHDRGIANRIDDSLVQVAQGSVRPLRRARGLAPRPLPLPLGFAEDHRQVLAFGGDIKNAFCIAKAGNAVVSQHIGDLASLATQTELAHGIALYERLYDLTPELIATDPHPAYHARSMARQMAEARGLPLVEVDHHHAHAAACMAEHGVALDAAPSLALVHDGIGLGPDGALWGAELLLCDYRKAHRLASLRPAPLPGGDAAARDPWRNLLARLDQTAPPEDWPGPLAARLRDRPVGPLRAAIRAGLNAPFAASAGRLFDAVAAAAGLLDGAQGHEAEAAMRLQAAAEARLAQGGGLHPYAISIKDGPAGRCIDPAPLWPQIAEDLASGAAAGLVAARFHAGWARIWARAAIEASGRSGSRRVFISGGVFQNRLLADMLTSELGAAGLEVLQHREVPANDGGLALGQIAIALARGTSDRGES